MDTPQESESSRCAGGACAPLGVLVVDDHRVFADALRLGLDLQPDLRCAGIAHSADEGLAVARSVAFDVALIDLDLPDASGLDTIGRLRAMRIHARLLVLTAHGRPDLPGRAATAGADGFLTKDAPLRHILDAVRGAAPTEIPRVGPHPGAGSSRAASTSELTPREYDVLRRLSCGEDVTRIARTLGISVSTARGHIKALIAKLGAHSQLGAVVEAERRGMISVGARF